MKKCRNLFYLWKIITFVSYTLGEAYEGKDYRQTGDIFALDKQHQ